MKYRIRRRMIFTQNYQRRVYAINFASQIKTGANVIIVTQKKSL